MGARRDARLARARDAAPQCVALAHALPTTCPGLCSRATSRMRRWPSTSRSAHGPDRPAGRDDASSGRSASEPLDFRAVFPHTAPVRAFQIASLLTSTCEPRAARPTTDQSNRLAARQRRPRRRRRRAAAPPGSPRWIHGGPPTARSGSPIAWRRTSCAPIAAPTAPGRRRAARSPPGWARSTPRPRATAQVAYALPASYALTAPPLQLFVGRRTRKRTPSAEPPPIISPNERRRRTAAPAAPRRRPARPRAPPPPPLFLAEGAPPARRFWAPPVLAASTTGGLEISILFEARPSHLREFASICSYRLRGDGDSAPGPHTARCVDVDRLGTRPPPARLRRGSRRGGRISVDAAAVASDGGTAMQQ